MHYQERGSTCFDKLLSGGAKIILIEKELNAGLMLGEGTDKSQNVKHVLAMAYCLF